MTAELSPAVIAAQKAQDRLNECLDAGKHFRLEAGAGAGKTYSLTEALKRIIAEKGSALMQAGQQVACITYTEVARKEITNDIEEHPAILVNTIHGFAWSFISRFQKTLRVLLAEDEARKEAIAEAGGVKDQVVEYSFGFFGIDEDRVRLHHDDVPRYFAKMFANAKFQRIFKSLYPILFIDEYQDTDPLVMKALTEHYFTPASGPIIGLFGDHWQTIFRKDYMLIDFPNVEPIDKGSNFRSVSAIVDVLNRLRPELTQEVDDPDAKGEARFFHCNTYTGPRFSSPQHGKDDLPAEMIPRMLERLKERLAGEGWDFGPKKTKILMLTHNAIAAERGYPSFPAIFDRNDDFVKKEDATVAFLADVVELFCVAYESRKYGEVFDLMGGFPTIRKSADKAQWRKDLDALLALRKTGTIGGVIDHLKATRRPRLSERVDEREKEIGRLGPEVTEDEPNSLKRHRLLRNVPYSELKALVEFIDGFTPFATQHSVKGAEFENVLVVLSGGWNHYNWPRFLENFATGKVAAKDQAGYYRARNLFYVALSRPKIRLAVLATQSLGNDALSAATKLFQQENVLSLQLDL
jgi:DNA helicase-2/ATP-dependent DNA helicase PcrA